MAKGGGGSSHTTTTQELSPEQRALLSGVIPIAQNFLANPPQMFPGSAIEGFDPLQKQAQQMTLNAAGQMQPILNQLPGQIQGMQQGYQGVQQGYQGVQAGYQAPGLQKGLNFLTSGDVLKASSNPYLQGAIQAASRPTVEAFKEDLMPRIDLSGVGTGGFGGTRSAGIATGLAAGKTSQAVADIASKMSNENYQAGLQAMLGGQQNALSSLQGQQGALAGQQGAIGAQQNLAGSTGGILGQMMLPSQMTEAVGAQRQGLNQALLSEAAQRYVNQQMIPFSAAQDVAAMAMGFPGGTTQSNTTQSGGGGGMQGLQTGLGVASLALPLLMKGSDRRLKENIKLVGRLYDGLNVYTFKYIGTPTMSLGLMADEVEALYPEAVFRDKHGLMLLDYNDIPSWPMKGVPSWSIH